MEGNRSKEKAETNVDNNAYLLPASVLVAGLMIAFAVVYSSGNKSGGGSNAAPQNNNQQANAGAVAAAPQISGSDAILGDPKAPVSLIEYGDYQCPFCVRFFTQTQPLLKKDYIDTGKVKMVFKDLVINDRASTDHESHNSALAAWCAKDQGKFWEFHDAIYQLEAQDEAANPQSSENNGNLNRAAFLKIAQSLGMDQAAFTSCFDSGKYAVEIQKDSDSAAGQGVNATPTFFLNSTEIQGAQPYQQFQSAIDSLLKTK